MSAAMASDTEEIYIRLLDEGIDVWRPTQGLRVGPMTFKVLPTPKYNPEDENWEFVPGTVVVCERRTLSEGPALVAVRHAEVSPGGPLFPPQQ
ncbi:MAG: hypothetical protein ACT4PV_10285 [Planctomycetaceae bacterium]